MAFRVEVNTIGSFVEGDVVRVFEPDDVVALEGHFSGGLESHFAQRRFSRSLLRMELKFDIRVEDGLLVAVCAEPHLATHASTMEELIQMVRELIACHFDEEDPRRAARPRFILHEESALAYA